ncbi:MAG: HAD family hydrolase, partial [Saprospiraceae bacterium]|nr:HAD family hydrolase [Saprospiraceae bacterium]
MEFDWIFFDCFNTLIDDFDHTGDESGMRPISHIPANHGLYESHDHFHLEYLQWRVDYWAKGNNDEVLLPDRFRSVLQSAKDRSGSTVKVASIIDEMMEAFYSLYPKTVRRSPEIESILSNFHGKVGMGVVSNFFLPSFPERLLREHQLDQYFDFIIDSAQIKVKKPGRKIYQHALDLAKVGQENRGRVLFVGDNFRNDVKAPRELGMQALH